MTSLATGAVAAASQFVNGLVIEATMVDASGGTQVNDGRLGFFSDLYYDPLRSEWRTLSDCGPGGGTLRYETRIHRFDLALDPLSCAISNFQVLQTTIFRQSGSALDGYGPEVSGPLRLSFDPEGTVVPPLGAQPVEVIVRAFAFTP